MVLATPLSSKLGHENPFETAETRRRRRPSARQGRWLLWAGGATLLFGACGSDAVGVDSCRQIETARCRVAEACGEIEDANTCARFYRDHCLHGFGLDEPSEREVEGCTRALEAAAECARSASDAEECENACRLVSTPEHAPECAFLSEEPPPKGEAGAGGGGGAPIPGDGAGQGGLMNEGGEPAGGGTGAE